MKSILPPTTPELRDAERAQLSRCGKFLWRNAETLLMLACLAIALIAGNWDAAQVIALLMVWVKIHDIRVVVTVEKETDDVAS